MASNSNGSRIDKARLTTGLVVVAAGLAVGLSIFAVNRVDADPSTVTVAADTSQVQSSTGAPVTTSAPGSGSAASPTTSRPAATTPPSSAAPAPAPTTMPEAQAAAPAAPTATATYTVQPGDNLTVIAAWFKLNGYGDLYEANKAVLGANPDLIYPGQTITLTVNGVAMATAEG